MFVLSMFCQWMQYINNVTLNDLYQQTNFNATQFVFQTWNYRLQIQNLMRLVHVSLLNLHLPIATLGLATLLIPTLLSARSREDSTVSSLSSSTSFSGDRNQMAKITTKKDTTGPNFIHEALTPPSIARCCCTDI